MTVAKKAVVIGAGPGGLASAMILAASGYKVSVYEKQPYIGGRNSRLELGEYRFDLGPTFLMMPQLLEELFRSVHRNLHDYLQLQPLDPLYRLQFGDLSFYPTGDQERMYQQIEELFPGNGAGYLRFMREEEEKFNHVQPLLQRPFGKLSDYLSRDLFSALPKLHALDTVYGRLSRYFTDERLKLAFTFQAKYLGMSPWDCPGTFTILSYLEHRHGLFHPIGGVNQVNEAMAAVIREYGGEIHTSQGVKRVAVRGGQAVGVLLEDGSYVPADDVVINADFGHAMTELFTPGMLKKYTKVKLDKKKYSCSTFMLYLGVNDKIDMPHHNIFFADEYRRNVEEITKTKSLSADASIYVHNPSALDPTLAPAGKSALYVLMPVPNLTGGIDWEQKKGLVREQILTRLQREPELRDLAAKIEVEHMITPQDWQDDMYVYHGATFNLAHSLDQMMYLRPHNRFEEVGHCWLVGGGTHPGSGLPTIYESARISCGLLMEQYQGKRPALVAAESTVDQGGGIGV